MPRLGAHGMPSATNGASACANACGSLPLSLPFLSTPSAHSQPPTDLWSAAWLSSRRSTLRPVAAAASSAASSAAASSAAAVSALCDHAAAAASAVCCTNPCRRASHCLRMISCTTSACAASCSTWQQRRLLLALWGVGALRHLGMAHPCRQQQLLRKQQRLLPPPRLPQQLQVEQQLAALSCTVFSTSWGAAAALVASGA